MGLCALVQKLLLKLVCATSAIRVKKCLSVVLRRTEIAATLLSRCRYSRATVLLHKRREPVATLLNRDKTGPCHFCTHRHQAVRLLSRFAPKWQIQRGPKCAHVN